MGLCAPDFLPPVFFMKGWEYIEWCHCVTQIKTRQARC
jgi:hypothetical protein